MADKNYKLKFTLTDGKTQEVEFTAPQGPKGDQGVQGVQGPKGDKGDTGANGAKGERGTSIIKVTTGPSAYTTTTGGFTPTHRIALSTVLSESGVDKVMVGDTLAYSYYQWLIGYIDTSHVYLGGRSSLRGATGEDGTSVTVKSVTESAADGGSNVVTFSDGKTVTIKNGSKGSTGATGKDGSDGQPGVPGADGNDGYTPVRGVDYWTEADKVEIVQRVIESLGGNPIFGIVDENNNIVVSGDLPDGTYSVKYEMENGTKLNIGNLVIDTNVYYTVTNTLTQCTTNNSATKAVQGGSYSATITAKSGYELKSIVVKMGDTDISSTAVSGGKITIANVTGNIVITAVAEEIKAAYTNILTSGKYTIEKNKRWSNSSKGYTACNGMIALVIPIADVLNKTIYFKGFPANIKANNSSPLWMTLDSSNSRVSTAACADTTGNIWTATNLLTYEDGVYGLVVNTTNFPNGTGVSLAINMAVNTGTAISAIPADAIMTIDEPIV